MIGAKIKVSSEVSYGVNGTARKVVHRSVVLWRTPLCTEVGMRSVDPVSEQSSVWLQSNVQHVQVACSLLCGLHAAWPVWAACNCQEMKL